MKRSQAAQKSSLGAAPSAFAIRLLSRILYMAVKLRHGPLRGASQPAPRWETGTA